MHPWALTSRPVYVVRELDLTKASDEELKEVVLSVATPLINAVERSPFFFGKYEHLIRHLDIRDMMMASLFKTLMDKPQYFKNPFFLGKSRDDVEKLFGKSCLERHERFVAIARFDLTQGYEKQLKKFVADGLLPTSFFDTQCLVTLIHLIVDAQIGDKIRQRAAVRTEISRLVDSVVP
jgi:hypothetical protein